MPRRIVRLVVLPVAVGLVMTLAVFSYVRQARSAGPVELLDVVVARSAVAARTQLQREMLATRQVPRSYLGGGELHDLSQAIGQTTVVPLAAGEVVLRSKLLSPETKTALAFHVPPGRRAVTIKATEISGVAGFPEPGDLVDVVATFTKEAGGIDKSRLILEGVRVLASGQRTAARQSLKEVKPPTSLTLAVTPEEAVRLVLAEERGSLRVLLRPAAPERDVGEIELTVRSFGGGLGGAAAAGR